MWHSVSDRELADPLDAVDARVARTVQLASSMLLSTPFAVTVGPCTRVIRVARSRLGAPRPGPIVIAVAEPRVRAWVLAATRRAGVDAVLAADLGALLDCLAAGCSGVIVGAAFDGLAADRLLAFVRTAGCAVRAVVVTSDPPDDLLARAHRLEPVEMMIAPRIEPGGPPDDAPRTRWLERCVELALGARRSAR